MFLHLVTNPLPLSLRYNIARPVYSSQFLMIQPNLYNSIYDKLQPKFNTIFQSNHEKLIVQFDSFQSTSKALLTSKISITKPSQILEKIDLRAIGYIKSFRNWVILVWLLSALYKRAILNTTAVTARCLKYKAYIITCSSKKCIDRPICQLIYTYSITVRSTGIKKIAPYKLNLSFRFCGV